MDVGKISSYCFKANYLRCHWESSGTTSFAIRKGLNGMSFRHGMLLC